MLAINLDSDGFINIREYSPKFGSFVTKSSQVLKSISLSNAFLVKYKLTSLKYKLATGWTILLPNLYDLSPGNITALRQFRFENIKSLKQKLSYSAITNRPTDSLVWTGLILVPLEDWLEDKRQEKLSELLRELARYIVYKNENCVYFKKSVYQPIKLWKAKFLRIGYNIEYFDLDDELGKLVISVTS
jgi:hypothetical protein